MFKQWLGRTVLRISGWEFVGEKPTETHYVVIAAPHTSNWDMIYMLASVFSCDLKIKWMGKHTIFQWPFGAMMCALGGIPIERHKRTNVVDRAAQIFSERDEFVLVVPAEGTRSYVPHWKSGFYHIALKADVPVCLSYLDFGTKRSGLGPMVKMTGDMQADMDKIRSFYADKKGLYPEKVGKIRLREETQARADAELREAL